MSQTQFSQTRLSQPPPACSSQQSRPAGTVGVNVGVDWGGCVGAVRRTVGERPGVTFPGRRVAVARGVRGVFEVARGDGVTELTNPLLPPPQPTKAGRAQISSAAMGAMARGRQLNSMD